MEPPGHQGKPEPCSCTRDLAPGYPCFWGLSGAKRTAMGYVVLAQVRPPNTTPKDPSQRRARSSQRKSRIS